MEETVRLRPFARRDIKQLVEWIDSPEFLVQWGRGFAYPLDEAQVLRLMEKASGEDPGVLLFAVTLPSFEDAVGHVQLLNINRTDKSAAVARVLVGPADLRSKGLGAEVMEAVLRFCFEKIGLHRVYLNVFDFNRPAISCYEKVGFQKEGLLRDTVLLGGRYWSHFTMSILEEEWRKRHAGAAKTRA